MPTNNEAERVVGHRKNPKGPGEQYEVRWIGQAETTWEAASRIRAQYSDLVHAFQQEQREGAGNEGAGTGTLAPTDIREQMAALEQLVRSQAEQMRTQEQQLLPDIVADALSRRADHSVPAAQSNLQRSFVTANPFAALAAVSARRPRPPESNEQRRRNIDAATKVVPPAPDALPPNRQGTIMTPTQRCSANTKSGTQCGQRTAVAHLCWNHLQRDMGVRVKKATLPGAGRGLFAAGRDLPAGHRIPYTGDEIALARGEQGGPYVLETLKGRTGIDAARRNAGLGRWVNDPRGGKDEHGRPLKSNCEFVLHTPPGGGQLCIWVRSLPCIAADDNPLVFAFSPDYLRRLMRNACIQLGVGHTPYVPHSLRHGGATADFLKTGSIERVQFRGRWKSMESLRTYVQTARALLAAQDVPVALNIHGMRISDALVPVMVHLLGSVPEVVPRRRQRRVRFQL